LKLEGDYVGAKSKYQEIEKEFPKDVVAKCGYADVLKLEGDYVGAKSKYQEIEKEFPIVVVAKNGYADVLKLEGDYIGAKSKYQEIEKEYPADLYSKHSLLVLSMITGAVFDDESKFLVKTNPVSMQDYYFYHAYIMFYIKMGLYERAETMILDVIGNVPFLQSKRLYRQTYLYLKVLLGRYQEVLKDVDVSDYDEKGCPLASVMKAKIFFANGLEEEAVKYLDLLKKYPENSVAYSVSVLMTKAYLKDNAEYNLNSDEDLECCMADEEFKLLALCA